VSPTECVPSPRVPLVQFSCSQASHAPHSFNLNLKMVSDQKYPRVHTIQTTCSCFYWFSIFFFLLDNLGYLPAVLVCGHMLDHGGFPVAARIGDANPRFTTDCCSNISSCKVSAQVQLRTLHKCYYKQNQNQPSQRAPMMGSSKVVVWLVAT